MKFSVNTSNKYNIVVEPGCLKDVYKYLDLKRKVLIVTDDGVPKEYSETVAKYSSQPYIVTVFQGEESKSVKVWEKLIYKMLQEGFSRSDCIVAVGGGVVGDLAGFVAASYMRGVDFYNIPTTVLSQVDSSIGGKTAINFGGIKNLVGAFYQPKSVLIDAELLKTLPKRHISNGLAESIKMALTSDFELFEMLENSDINDTLPSVIEKSLMIKKHIVEEDEKEQGFRKILNFGHTIGHGIESFNNFSGFFHGECVALGMLPMCSESVRERLIKVLDKLNLPVKCDIDMDKVYDAITHDKKISGNKITVVIVEDVGRFKFDTIPVVELRTMLNYFRRGGA